ncbi:MAG: hypothetical protein ACRD0E_00115 [Acidimicrobiales bacterium]
MLTEHVKAPRIRYSFECYDKDGKLKWKDYFDNLVTSQGKNYILATGAATAIAKYLGLVDGGTSPSYAAADVMSSHGGWTENTSYSNGTHPTITWGSASGGSMSTSAAAVFNINAAATIAGAFSCDNSTKAATSGNLYSEGSFTGGNKTVASGDTLNVSLTFSV